MKQCNKVPWIYRCCCGLYPPCHHHCTLMIDVHRKHTYTYTYTCLCYFAFSFRAGNEFLIVPESVVAVFAEAASVYGLVVNSPQNLGD